CIRGAPGLLRYFEFW
nr:immunoglobulin heavy chain junction region [Macaca mulatta]MOW75150.1 immunoglobulin heavy chain junction region [Macaca mulatta]MOW75184.1 immunoglobulin heavy chain junction region [Macaca mulatta]MOW75234.1 immunoglobulin heavy chain junction region [Macaca mulatta]MOW75262.1 immunoglobulin heavy chain junction region [Macaca mulatta]